MAHTTKRLMSNYFAPLQETVLSSSENAVVGICQPLSSASAHLPRRRRGCRQVSSSPLIEPPDERTTIGKSRAMAFRAEGL